MVRMAIVALVAVAGVGAACNGGGSGSRSGPTASASASKTNTSASTSAGLGDFCATIRVAGDAVQPTFAKLGPKPSAQALMSAADTFIAEAKKALEDKPPGEVKPAFADQYEAFVRLRQQLAASNFDYSKFQQPPPALHDVQQSGTVIHTYLFQHCKKQPPPPG